ncbi:MAG: sigma-54-dependent Fis family transcriptional regulator [Nitrospirae bacterium]|nr:sigma-54-dependent Fis family transcriptional regulator [Nitrospirota bacterium]
MRDRALVVKQRSQFHNFIGKNPRIQELYNLVETLANLQSTVLITGESGTGKELIAEALHFKGIRQRGPMVKVNCSALSVNILESELFGHVKGAFTGAIRDRIGRFETARGGSIFLDEIGDISPRVQIQLLRVLEDRVIERLGQSTPIKVDVRIITATNRPLAELVASGGFRNDLFYRLKVVELFLPPLRHRRDDIPLLVEHFLKRFSIALNKELRAVSDDCMYVFLHHQWPGNVRELEHILEHAAIVCQSPLITYHDLPRSITEGFKRLSHDAGNQRQEIIEALDQAMWNKSRAARLLGISRRTIYRKMLQLDISSEGSL